MEIDLPEDEYVSLNGPCIIHLALEDGGTKTIKIDADNGVYIEHVAPTLCHIKQDCSSGITAIAIRPGKER